MLVKAEKEEHLGGPPTDFPFIGDKAPDAAAAAAPGARSTDASRGVNVLERGTDMYDPLTKATGAPLRDRTLGAGPVGTSPERGASARLRVMSMAAL